MSKEIENRVCPECESSYKIVYDLTETSGYSKFCCFCGGELYVEEGEDESDDE